MTTTREIFELRINHQSPASTDTSTHLSGLKRLVIYIFMVNIPEADNVVVVVDNAPYPLFKARDDN